MKKIVALVLCLVMVLGLMTGCQKKMDAQTLAQKMDEASKNVTAMAGKLDMELEMTMGMSGMTMTMGLDADVDMKVDMTKYAVWVDMDAAMDVLGETQDMGMEIYAVGEEDGSMTMYMHENSTDMWIKSIEEGFAEQVNQITLSSVTFAEIPAELMSLAEEKQTVGGTECYVLTVNMDGTYFADQMKAGMEIGMEAAMDEETASMMEAIDWTKLNAKAVYYVDAASFNIVQCDMEILGMGEMLNDIIGAAMAEAMAGMGGEELEMTIEVPVCKMTMSEMTYTGVEVPAVPQEAIDNAIDADEMAEEPIVDGDDEMLTNEPQADGSYILTLNSSNVRVMLPEGYVAYAADPQNLVGMTDDMLNFVTYMMVPDVTGEDMAAGVLSEVDWAEQEGYYKSHSEVTELEGFQTMSLIYNDNTSIWYAWTELDGGVLLMGAEVEGETFDLAALVASVVIE